ncbi:MAG: MgtC/SapB family protein [Xanthomonadales bacterium]|nr:MgtC/SapB family protein [Xanthomonadales bacterium]
MTELLEINWTSVLSNLIHLVIAYALVLPVGWNRERDGTAGLRTFPMVAVATCGYMLIGIEVLSTTEAEARAMVGVITGMGFIGGGAILKKSDSVSGTATAASLWTCGAIGLAVAWNRFEIAVLLAALNFLTLRLMQPAKEIAHDGEDE